MAWRLASSLVVLRNEVNALAPNRSKISDGTIGDTAHQNRNSDHNPNSSGVVCAFDITHDPSGGFDAHRWADHIRRNRHPNVKYVISNRRIASAIGGWAWRTYTGSNAHTRHIHVSVGVGSSGHSQPGTYDNTSSWGIKPGTAPPKPPPSSGGFVEVRLPLLRRGAKGGVVKSLQSLLNAKAGQGLKVDGDFGPKTEQAVKNVQGFFRLSKDGIVGSKTWPTLFL